MLRSGEANDSVGSGHGLESRGRRRQGSEVIVRRGRAVRSAGATLAAVVLLSGVLVSSAHGVLRARGVVLATVLNPSLNPDVFGDSVAIWGDTMLVGAPDFGNNRGRAYFYVKTNGAWPANPTVTLKDPHNVAGDEFGISQVAMYAGSAVVCAPNAYNSQGACYVYVRAGGVWPAVPSRVLRDPTRPLPDGFGVSVAIWNRAIVIGMNNSVTHAAYVYVRAASGWPANPAEALDNFDHFGFSVAISENTVLIGDPNFPDTSAGDGGAVEVYVRSGSLWPTNPSVILPPPVPADAAVFGWSVAVDKSAIVVGDQAYSPPGGRPSSGATYLYAPSVTAASLPVRTLLDPANGLNDGFGSEVAISGTNLIVGAPWGADYHGVDAAYVYKKAAVWPLVANDSVVDASLPDTFLGDAVAIQGVLAVIPSPNANSDSGFVSVYHI